jgi:hypothetical protein
MAARHCPEKADDPFKRNKFPDDAKGAVDKLHEFSALRAPRSNPKRGKSLWSSALDYFIESLALYGVAMHPEALFAIESARAEDQSPQLRDIHHGEWQGMLRLITSRIDCGSNRKTRAGLMVALSEDGSRESEQKINTTVAALAKLDDQTLLALGIPDRSQIELVVRYCYDC